MAPKAVRRRFLAPEIRMRADKWQQAVKALVTRGGWTGSREWVPVPYVEERAAEELFRHKVLGLLRRRGLLGPERIELLLSWTRSGFSVHKPGLRAS